MRFQSGLRHVAVRARVGLALALRSLVMHIRLTQASRTPKGHVSEFWSLLGFL